MLLWFSTWFKNRIEFLRCGPKYVFFVVFCIALWATSVVFAGGLCSSQDAKSGATVISPAKIKLPMVPKPLGLGEHRRLHVMRMRHIRRASFQSPNPVAGQRRTAHFTGSGDEALLVLCASRA